MMTARPKLAASVITALFLSVPLAYPATEGHLSGSIAGVVRNASGVPQMGATVFLFNRSERLLERAITNERGLFGFGLLTPDLYSVRVSLASFIPAVKQQIAVQPGMQSLLYVNLASVLSSIELVYAKPGEGALMSDDWKWVLKESTATRPVLRMLPGYSGSDPEKRQTASGGVFSDTRGVLNLSAATLDRSAELPPKRIWGRLSQWRHRCSGTILCSSAATSVTARMRACPRLVSAPAIAGTGWAPKLLSRCNRFICPREAV